MSDFIAGIKIAKLGLTQKKSNPGKLIADLMELAALARRDGVLALEGKLPDIQDHFMKRALQLVVDGVDAAVARDALETEIHVEFTEDSVGAKVWETAGGFAPTVGIIGAVLGLIHVMENLSDPSKLGGGIAVAFVATVYGVALANLVFLPIAGKLKIASRVHTLRGELIQDGLVGIANGENPRLIATRLSGYLVK